MNLIPQADHATVPRLKAAVLGMIGSFILFTAYLAVPPVGIVSGILAPFPACYVRLLHGRISSTILTLGVTAAVTALFGIFAGCLYLGMCGTIGMLMPELLARGFSGSRTMFWTSSANLTVLTAGILVYSITTGLDLQKLVSGEITSSLNQALLIYEKGGVKGEELDAIKLTMRTVADMLYRLYPSFVTIMIITMAGCNLALLKKTTALSKTNLNIGEFGSYKNPDMLVWLLIASGFSFLISSKIVTTPALNILLIVSLLYFLQGLAVITTLISRQSFSGVLRVGLYVMLLLQPYLATIVAGIGLFDLWGDFRTPKKQENL
ncbi:MAG: YybS family protein [Desulfuromonadaceae bacterium]|nr:YybS family protein [Desulfuromonadaceae bacterium]